MTPAPGQIRLAALDPMLYGAARSFDYLGVHGQDMLDRVGEGIITYAVSQGFLERSNDPHQLVNNMVRFFAENGYVGDVRANQSGDTLEITMHNWQFLPLMKRLRANNSYLLTCPICIANNAITRTSGILSERISDTLTPDGVYTMKLKLTKLTPGAQHSQKSVVPMSPADFSKTTLRNELNDNIGLPAFESVTYGLACGFDYLGAQGQLILDNIGKEMLGFLREEANLRLPNDLAGALESLASFFADNGLADKIQVSISKNSVRVEFKNSHYLPVLKRLLEEERSLLSCPFTLAARAVIHAHGFQMGETKWQANATDATATTRLRESDEQRFDEDAVARLMDQV
jgi:hypothetical protein